MSDKIRAVIKEIEDMLKNIVAVSKEEHRIIHIIPPVEEITIKFEKKSIEDMVLNAFKLPTNFILPTSNYMNCKVCLYNNTKYCICPCMGEAIPKGKRWRNKLKAVGFMGFGYI